MKRRLLCLLLIVILALSLIPISAVAANDFDPYENITNQGENSENGLVTNKKLSKDETTGEYDLTLEAYATGNTFEETEMTPMDIVMVIDQSAGMGTTDMNPEYKATDSKKWTVNDATGSGKTYYYKVGNKYYPVQAQEGTIYEKVASNPHIYQMIGRGHDGASLGVNGTPTHFNVPTGYYCLGSDNRIHKVYVITAGVFAMYYAYPYYYLDENDYYASVPEWQNNIYWVAGFDPWVGHDYNKLREKGLGGFGGEKKEYWKTLTDNHRVNFLGQTNMNQAAAKACRCEYSWISNGDEVKNLYLPKDGVNYNGLFYVDDNGNKVPIGNTVDVESATAYSGVLYKVEGESRVSVLQTAATQFVDAVKANAEENDVDHRIAMVGFAGNRFPTVSTGTTAYNTTKYDFTNSGLFIDGGFKNYQKITSLDSTTERYINLHYYDSSAVSDGKPAGSPLYYKGGAWYRMNTGQAYSGTFYKANYADLSASDYQNSLETVTDSTDYNYLKAAINNFSHYGGSYTSYGMTMANNVFENNTKTYVDQEGNTQQRARVIVVFTCGEPGGNGYSSSIAGEALVDGNRAKYASDANGYDATVYTIGLFPGNASTETETFMRQLSSQYTVPVSNVYGGNNNGVSPTGSGSLDGSSTYYIQDTDGKTLAVTTQNNGQSTLGWWRKTNDGYVRCYPKTAYNDDRTIDGQPVITFYNSSGNAVYEENLNTGTVYFTSSSTRNTTTAIKYEYRWYDSNNKVRDPIKQNYGTYDTERNTWQFFALGTPTENSDGGTYYYDVKNEAATLAAFEEAFEQIKTKHQKTISNTDLSAESSVVRDVISDQFDKCSDFSVTCQTADAVFTNNTLEWDDPVTASGITATANGKTIDVEGFDFSENYVSADRTGESKGKKLIVKIKGIMPNTVGTTIPSNTDTSAVYGMDNGVESAVTAFLSPTLDSRYEQFHVQVATYSNGAFNDEDKWVKKDYTFADGYFENGRVKPYDKRTLLVKEGDNYKYLYGGLYENAEFTEPVKAANMRGLTFTPEIGKTYYIKQVDPSYLKVKTIYTSWGDDVVSMYPVTVVDSKNYSEAGLIRNVQKGEETITSPLSNTDSYDMIRLNYKNGNKIYTSDGRSVTIDGTTYDNPTNLFGVPGYMVVKNETQNGYTGSYQPYWITLDGVKVTGQMVRTLNNTSKVSEMKSGVSDVNKLENIDISGDTKYTEETATPLKVKSMFVSADEEEEPVDNGITLAGYTTSLNGNIAMNFYMDLSDEVAADKDAYMQFTLPGANHTEEVVKLADAKKQVRGGKTYYVFSAGVAAKDMTSDIKAQFVKGDGTKSEVWSYTIKEYCDYIRSHPESYDKESVALVENMLNYGGYAQTYFKHNTDKMANANLDLALPEVDLDESYDPVVSGECTGLTYQGTSSMLTTTTGLKHYFVIAGDASDYTFKVNGKELQLQSDKTGTYVHVDNIKAKDLSKPTALTVTNKDGSVFTLKYSVYTNVKQVVASESFTTEAKNMMKALYGYGEAAIAYFATRN